MRPDQQAQKRRVTQTGNKKGMAQGKRPKQGAATPRKSTKAELQSYLAHHRKSALTSYRRLRSAPFSALLTWLVVGIALALPGVMLLTLGDIQGLDTGVGDSTQITLYLELDVSETRALQLLQSIRSRQSVANARFVSKSTALKTLSEQSDFSEVIRHLEHNPLPHVIIVNPNLLAATQSGDLEQLQTALAALPEVEQAKLDMLWMKRLFAIGSIVERSVWALGLLLAIAVLLIVGNTIRLEIENRRDEIVVLKLVGGTNSFVRRPFLYHGAFAGLGGGVVAALLVEGVFVWLNQPIAELSNLYGSGFQLTGMDSLSLPILLVASICLGILGARIAVSRHLKTIEPS